MYWKKRIRLA